MLPLFTSMQHAACGHGIMRTTLAALLTSSWEAAAGMRVMRIISLSCLDDMPLHANPAAFTLLPGLVSLVKKPTGMLETAMLLCTTVPCALLQSFAHCRGRYGQPHKQGKEDQQEALPTEAWHCIVTISKMWHIR